MLGKTGENIWIRTFFILHLERFQQLIFPRFPFPISLASQHPPLEVSVCLVPPHLVLCITMGLLSKEFICSTHQSLRSDHPPCKGTEEVDFDVAHSAKLGQIIKVHLARNLFCQVQGPCGLKITQTVGDNVKNLLAQQFGVAMRIVSSSVEWEIYLAMLPNETSAQSTLYARKILQNGDSYPLGKWTIVQISNLLFLIFIK